MEPSNIGPVKINNPKDYDNKDQPLFNEVHLISKPPPRNIYIANYAAGAPLSYYHAKKI